MLLLALLLAAVQPADTVQTVVEQARLAVEGDSIPRVRARLDARLRRNPADRVAALGLASLARFTYDYDGAQRRYERLFIARPDDRDVVDAMARIGLARALEAHGKPGRGPALMRDALATARARGARAIEAEALYGLSFALATEGGLVALAHADSAAAAVADGHPLHAAARCRRAQVFSAMGLPGFADSVRAAMPAARRAQGPEALATCLRAATVAHRALGEEAQAAETIEELIALRQRTRDRSGLAFALVLRGDHLRTLGDFGGGVRRFRQALREAQASRNLYVESTVSLALGATALTMNDHAAAREYVDRAIAAFTAAGDSASLRIARSFRPFVSIAAGELDTARRQTLEQIATWRAVGDWQHNVQLFRQLALVEMRAGNLDAATRALDSADAAVRVHGGDERATVRVLDRGRVALLRGDLETAERRFRDYLAALDTTDRLLRYEAQLRLAEVYARRGELARAADSLAAADRTLDAWRATLDDPGLRTLAFQATPMEGNDRNASVAVVLAALARGGHAQVALELAERRRARELSERLARARAFGTVRDSAGPRDAARARRAGIVDVAELARAIPDDSTAVLEYVTGTLGAPTSLLVLRRARDGSPIVSGHALPPADSLVARIARLVAMLEGGDDPGAISRSLGATLLDAALRELGPGISRLILVPDGPLHRVPWDALRLADGRYVVERYTTSMAPSLGVLATLWRTPRRQRDVARVLAFGNPQFGNMEGDGGAASARGRGGDTYRAAFDAAGGLAPLPGTATEARLVARYSPAGLARVGGGASVSFLRSATLADYDVLHFATHALVDEHSAARSALALAAGDAESGFLGPVEMADLDLDAALVVLSACRSAGGVVVDGEGVQGLTAPLLEAGARSVVATTWRIGDRRTVPFIRAFYDALADSLPVAEALRMAKLDAIRRGAPPSEWAAFAAIGDPFVRVPLSRPPSPHWLLAGAAAILALVGVGTRGYSMRSRRIADRRSASEPVASRTQSR